MLVGEMYQSASSEDRQKDFLSMVPVHFLASGFCGPWSITKWYILLFRFTAHVFLFSGAVLNCVNQEEE